MHNGFDSFVEWAVYIAELTVNGNSSCLIDWVKTQIL